MVEFIGTKLKPNCDMAFKIYDVTEENVKIKDFNTTLFYMHTDVGTYRIPQHLRKQLSKDKSYSIKSRHVYNSKFTTCSYCNGKGCKECGQTGHTPFIIYEASEK